MTRLPDLVRQSAQRWPEAIALAPVRGSETGFSYRQLLDHVQRGAGSLACLGLDVGDRVVLSIESSAAWPIAFFSILEAGLVAVPVPAETPVSTVAGIAAFAGARAAVVSDRTRSLADISGLRCVSLEELLRYFLLLLISGKRISGKDVYKSVCCREGKSQKTRVRE